MTEVTDKMVETARDSLKANGRMRAAIEAAFAAREPVTVVEFVHQLRNYSVPNPRNKAADVIEELVDALQNLLGVVHFDSEEVHAARTLLTSMGVKL